LTFIMSSTGMPSVMQTDQLHLGVDRLEDRVGGKGRRHVDHGGIGAGHGLGLMDRVEDRQVEMVMPAFAGRHAADHLGAVGDGLFGVEGALRAGEALADHLGVFVDENGHIGRRCLRLRSGHVRLNKGKYRKEQERSDHWLVSESGTSRSTLMNVSVP
jgi:hypothetical protein